MIPTFKAKEKERRLKLREEKIEQQRIHQEERVRKALERAKAEPKKQVGLYVTEFLAANSIRVFAHVLKSKLILQVYLISKKIKQFLFKHSYIHENIN